MRRINKIKTIQINSHPNLYNKMEEIRKRFLQESGIQLSQRQLTDIISQRLRPINKINILGVKNAKTIKKKS